MISLERIKELAIEDITENPEKHLEEYSELIKLNHKYLKTLTEIKEIAEQGVMFDQILQKINEVDNGN